MSNNDKIDLLQKSPLFRDLSIDGLASFTSLLTEQVFSPGELLIEQDTDASLAFIIYEGSVRAYRLTEEGSEVNLNILGPGEIVGEMSLIDGQLRSANIEAIQTTKVLTLKRSDFIKILQTQPNLAISLMVNLSKRLRANDQYLEDLLSKDLYSRTWKTLTTLSYFFPNNDIHLSQEELANIIGATRARVTETLNLLQKEGKINLAHRKIHLN